MHYTRRRRHGDPSIVQRPRRDDSAYDQLRRKCQVEGCGRPHSCKGFCKLHYWRWTTHHDLDYQRPKPLRDVRKCSVPGCGRESAAKGYCQSHYLKWTRYGDPLYVTTRSALSRQQVLASITVLPDQTSTFVRRHHSRLYNSAEKHFGTWRRAIQVAGINYWEITKLKRGFWTKRKVISRIRKVRDDDAIRAERAAVETPDLFGAACTLFGSWKAAVLKAGRDYWSITRYKHGYWTEKRVLSQIKKLKVRSARHNYANHRDLATAAARIFGSWGKAVEKAKFNYDAIRFAFKDQDSCLITLDELLGEKAKREHTFGWLKDKGKLRLDGYYEKHRLAVEYDGPQHYESPGGYYTEAGLREIQRRDRLKDDLLRKHNVTLLRVKYDQNRDKVHLRARLNQLGIRVPPGAAPS